MYGLCKASKFLSTKIKTTKTLNNITDLSGTGGGSLKTINVSTLASFLVSAAGYSVAKQAFWGVTSPTGSADIFQTFGIDLRKITKDKLLETLNKVGICPYFNPVISPKMKNRSKLAKLIFKKQNLQIKSPFSIASFVYSPFNIKRRIYGCYSQKYLKILGEVFYKLDYDRTLIIHGLAGLPEVSNVENSYRRTKL